MRTVALFAVVGVLCMNAADSGTPRPLVHGHRGARARLPENTLPAFEYAIHIGVDVLELDMAVTKDNVLVVSHDPLLEKPLCSGPRDKVPIHELTYKEVLEWDCGAMKNPRFPDQRPVPGTRMPALDQVFALASKGSFDYNIETKIYPDQPQFTPDPETFVKLVLEQIRKHRLEKRIILQSFDYRTLRAMKKLAPEIRLSALMEDTEKRDFVTVAREAQAGIVSPNLALVTPEKTAAAHKAGLQVVPWTANKPAEWEALVKSKVDAIISDDPESLIEWLKRKGLR
jgi:glycerophosphoryl diester phosphodiesterase